MSDTPSSSAACCDVHNRNCEPPSELCCYDCPEAHHVGIDLNGRPIHDGRSSCVDLLGHPAQAVEALRTIEHFHRARDLGDGTKVCSRCRDDDGNPIGFPCADYCVVAPAGLSIADAIEAGRQP